MPPLIEEPLPQAAGSLAARAHLPAERMASSGSSDEHWPGVPSLGRCRARCEPGLKLSEPHRSAPLQRPLRGILRLLALEGGGATPVEHTCAGGFCKACRGRSGTTVGETLEQIAKLIAASDNYREHWA